MRVLITGSQGYLGTVMAQVFAEAGHEVTGLDTGLFAGCVLGSGPCDPPTLATDLRDVTASDLTGFDAVVHLAALSGPPRDAAAREVTRHVNHVSAVRLAHAAKAAGVGRYLFASTSSVYGTSPFPESVSPHPLDACAHAKVRVEEEVAGLSAPGFVPVFLRLAIAFGFSPRFRSDLLLNHMVGDAVFAGTVRAPAGADTRWPMVHVQDVASAFLLCLTAPPETVDCAAFNVGSEGATMSGSEIASLVVEAVPGATHDTSRVVAFNPGPSRVDFEAIRLALGFEARWGIVDGVAELRRACTESGLDAEAFFSRFSRRDHLSTMRESGELDDTLRCQEVLA